MKTSKRIKSFLPAAVMAAAVVAGNTTYTSPAYSCGWLDPWNCFDDAASWVWDKAKGAGNWFKDTGRGIGQFAVRDIWGNLITTISCPFTRTDAYGVTLACFPGDSMQTTRIRRALRFVATDPRSDHTFIRVTNGTTTQLNYFQPSTFSIGRIAYIIDGHASEASVFTLNLHDENSDAQATIAGLGTSAPVVVWPSAYVNYPTDLGLAGVLVHEADHTRFGGHTCASWGDTYEDGPYGTEIQYLARIWRTGHPAIGLTSFDKDNAWDKATHKLGQICDAAAQRRLWNTFLTDTPAPTNAVVASAATTWQQAASAYVTDLAVIDGGSIFGVGSDGVVYRSSAGAGWVYTTPSPASPAVSKISVTPNGTIYGIGSDNAVYSNPGGRYGYSSTGFGWIVSPWTQVASPWVQQISVTPNGTIYGIGSDNAVYRTTAGAGWAQVATPWVKDISVTPDGTIYGVSSDNAVWRTVSNRWSWERITSDAVTDISVTPNGFIYGLGTDNAVYMTRPTAGWQSVASPWVKNIAVSTDGTIYAIGGDNSVFVHGSKR